MKTLFASPARESSKTISYQANTLAQNPMIEAVLAAASGLLCVLNSKRQVVALNHTLLDFLGVKEPAVALGLRLGEAVNCAYAHNMEGGCGTGAYCSECGAVLAMLACLNTNKPVQKKCALRIDKSNALRDMCLWVHCSPLNIDNEAYLIIFMQDITTEERRKHLQQAFLHDLANVTQSLITQVYTLELAADESPDMLQHIVNNAQRMAKEIEVQRVLINNSAWEQTVNKTEFNWQTLQKELLPLVNPLLEEHQVELELEPPLANTSVNTDFDLLLRILFNMVKNAIEASAPGQKVTLGCTKDNNLCRFWVHNPAVIPPQVAQRVFQAHYSTKPGEGRGIGTFSMKLLGEQVLRGRVYFATEQTGTTFVFELPHAYTHDL